MTEIEEFAVHVNADTTRVTGRMMYARGEFPATDPGVPAPEFEWQMPTRQLLSLDAVITKPGCLPGVRVTGTIDPGGIAAPIAAVRTRLLATWRQPDDLPSCRLLLEAVEADQTDDDLRDAYSTTLLDLNPGQWRQLRNVLRAGADEAGRDTSDRINPSDSN